MKTGLLIIDMQNGFSTSKDRKTRKNCIIQIKRAMKKNLPIFIIEFTPERYGKTSKYITRVVGNYKNLHYIEKNTDDGGRQIMDYIKSHNLDIKHFIACGVNISFCVASTVRRLIEKYGKKVLVIRNACNCEYDREDAFNGNHGNIDTREVYESKLVTLI